MPYINQDQRPAIDDHVDALADQIQNRVGHEGGSVHGEFNYAVTRLLRTLAVGARYEDYAAFIGDLESIKNEFFRRVVDGYEDRKRTENGDVFDESTTINDVTPAHASFAANPPSGDVAGAPGTRGVPA